jgi:hypothetical protein
MYTKAVVWATSANPLPMWDLEGSGMVPVPNMVADFRDTRRSSSVLMTHFPSDLIPYRHGLESQ